VAEVIIFAVIASSALVIGGVLGAYWDAPTTFTGIMLAFASGSLIAALCFELFPEAFELGGAWRAGIGLLLGGASFVAANAALDHWVAGSAQKDQREKVQKGSEGVGFALLAAVTLDGVPENLALGVSLIDEGSLTLLVAIFFSNLPESLVGAVAMRRDGRSVRYAITIWALCAVLLALAVVLGWAALGGASEHLLAFFLAYAGGAVLASLADTLMPEAFEHGKPWNSFATAAGFFLAFMLATV
jgi:ZIP family zinc transporter